MMGEIAKIKQPNESPQRGKRAPVCSILCSTFSTQNNNEKTVKRDYCRTHMFLTKLQVYTHTQNSLVTFFPMTAWEFLCSGVTAQCEMQREKVCVCVKPVRGAGPEVARSLERRCLLCSFKLHRETERG